MTTPESAPLWRPPTPLPGVLETPRLEIRRYREADAPQLFEAIDASREALLPWLAWAETDHRTPEQSVETIRRFRAEYGRAGEADATYPLAIFDRRNGSLVGGTGFHAFDPPTPGASIGYWTRADVRRQGLCLEAARALITDAFTRWGLRRVNLFCSSENRGSRAVVDRMNLRLEAVRRDTRWYGERIGWTDEHEYAVLIHEWDSARGIGPGGKSVP